MIILKSAHDLIVAMLMASANERLAAKDEQIADLKAERDHYRKEWTRSRGKAFSSQPDKAEPPLPLFERSSVEQSADPPIDADWTADDRYLYQDWVLRNVPEGVDAEQEWRRLHGDRPPLLELTV